MDIGKLVNNSTFYDGFEGEKEIILSVVEKPNINIHIWEGYFYDFFGSPAFDCNGWKGFTRDYNQMERTFGDDEYIINQVDIKEYLDDILHYADKKYEYNRIYECYELLCIFFEYALNNHYQIKMQIF